MKGIEKAIYVATSKKTRQGLKLGHDRPLRWVRLSCNEQENPTGIETSSPKDPCPDREDVATSKKTRQGLKPIRIFALLWLCGVATSKKTRQGLKLLQESHIGIWPGMCCNEQENPTGIETDGHSGHPHAPKIVATSKKTRQGLKLSWESLRL